MASNPALQQLILERIAQAPQGRISFADFMELALYHPQQGYYSRQVAVGAEGDFITASRLSQDFGELLAVQFAEMWERLGRPEAFALVEMGAGQGLVAADVLGYLQQHYPPCFAALTYWIVERSAGMRQQQRQRLADWEVVQWATLETLPQALVGCLFSNELVDALPVHVVEQGDAGLQEVYVTAAGEQLQGVLGPLSTPQLADYFAQVGVDLSTYGPGYRTEVNLAALEWMAQVAAALERGYVLTIDYGYPASRYYSRVRSQGTLQCYYRHRHHDDPYANLGHQDITAHVDFTALEHQGQRYGLAKIGGVPQGMFLMALGVGERLQQLAELPGTDSDTVNYAIRRRSALHQLIDPMGMGNFMVLVQGKGVALGPLKGLEVPPLA